jgi:hypothetical protein
LQVPHVTSLPLVEHVLRLPRQMSQCVVVYDDEERRATFKVTPPILYRIRPKPPNRTKIRCYRAQRD